MSLGGSTSNNVTRSEGEVYLTEAEIPVLLALYVLGGEGTAKKIARITGMNVQVVRNTLRRLEKKNLTRAERKVVGYALLTPGFPSETIGGKEVYYKLLVDIDTLFRKYGNTILEWARNATGDDKMDFNKLREILENKKKEVQKSKDLIK